MRTHRALRAQLAAIADEFQQAARMAKRAADGTAPEVGALRLLAVVDEFGPPIRTLAEKLRVA